ncbi:MAG: sensor protein KdpD [Bacteroidetes bacterium]|nr:MAG: sensor protein KdpD [Bacteroidota bacterium]
MEDKTQHVAHFLDLIRKSRRGKCKIYIGMSAGVGKTYRMLQEAQALVKNGVDVKIGYVETHGRTETEAQLRGLPLIPRRKLFYKGKELEEMDLAAILRIRPELVVVDELAHTNIEGSQNEKRWQDVRDLLDAGINVITAVNIQHIESLNEEVKKITGIEVQERVPDLIIAQADEVVNIDLTASELIARLKEGKVYAQEKVETALKNFFKPEHLLQLREMALKTVASQVGRQVETEVPKETALRHERFLACISSNEKHARTVLRKSSRLAQYYACKWYVLYVETPPESPEKIALGKQRHLINNFKLATELGAELIRVKHSSVSAAIMEVAEHKEITTIILGKPRPGFVHFFSSLNFVSHLMRNSYTADKDLIFVS